MSVVTSTGGPGVVNTLLQTQGQAMLVPGACPHCSSPFHSVMHSGPCPRVRAIEYYADGAVKRVEFNPEPPALAVDGAYG